MSTKNERNSSFKRHNWVKKMSSNGWNWMNVNNAMWDIADKDVEGFCDLCLNGFSQIH